jgi:hypothetical protein
MIRDIGTPVIDVAGSHRGPLEPQKRSLPVGFSNEKYHFKG